MTARTVGVEEEMFLVDPATGVPVPRSGEALAADARLPDAAPQDVTQELFLEQLETTTEPAASLAELRSHLLAARRRAAEDARRVGAALLPSPTTVLGHARSLSPGPRYRGMALRHPDLFPDVAVCGMHVHVGVEDDEEAVRVLDRLAPWLPVVTALTAGSPFADGVDTGHASWRARQWDRWPTAGPCEPFGDLAGYRRVVELLVASGAALDEGMVYLDARVGRATPTVEVRVADVLVDPEDAVAVAGLLRALVETVAAEPHLPAGWSVPALRAARWLARRDGLGADLLDPLTARPVPAPAAVDTLLRRVEPALRAAGDARLVHDAVAALVRDGGPAGRARGTATGDPRRWLGHLLEHGVGAGTQAGPTTPGTTAP